MHHVDTDRAQSRLTVAAGCRARSALTRSRTAKRAAKEPTSRKADSPMKRAFYTPRGVRTAFWILAIGVSIPTFMTSLEAVDADNRDLALFLFGLGLGEIFGGIIIFWLLWVAGKNAWLGIRALVRRGTAIMTGKGPELT